MHTGDCYMNTESQYEKMYNDLVAGLEKMHVRNVNRTRSALKSLLIVPTIFLILLFVTQSSKTIFLILWIASMFLIASVLVIVEYQDYLLRKMFTELDKDENDASSEDLSPIKSDALLAAARIRESVLKRAPECDLENSANAQRETADNH